MNVHHCLATKRDGRVCSAALRPGEFRCGHHKPSYERLGPRMFAYSEIRSKTSRMYRDARLLDIDRAQLRFLNRKIDEWGAIALRTFEVLPDARVETVLNQHERQWYLLNTPEPIGPDGVINVDLGLAQQPRRRPPIQPRARRPAAPPAELQQFVADNQNVHRAATVKMVTDVIEKVLKIEVPKPYQWNLRRLSKTPGCIITDCKLTIPAGMAMMEKYSKPDNIYELGNGIYGRVLDRVWQFISKSDDKESLCAILRSELQDNVGMCMQGNLSRLCNVLSGYLDDIKIAETPAERLGREFPKLMEIGDESERLRRARDILKEVGLPVAEWSAWTDALVN